MSRSAGGGTTGLAPTRGFRADVQALRGLAVLLVVLFHAQVATPGGFVGVDVFFVISGYVIGRRLVGELTTAGRISFRSFYERRARRILPALAVMLGIVLLVTPLLASIAITQVTNRTGIAASLFNANRYLYQVTSGGYFAPAADLNPLLHTWSLSVEEQFYFVIPGLLGVAVWATRRRHTVGTLRIVVGAMIVVSFALCLLFSYSTRVAGFDGPRFAFFSPFTRAWEFAIGIALVLVPRRWLVSVRAGRVLVVVGLVAIGIAAVAFSDTMRFPGVAALLPVLGAALVVHGGSRADETVPAPAPRSLAPMVALGDVSYSWYLWHWPLIVFAAAFWPHGGRLPLLIAATVSLLPAWASYRLLETPLRRLPSRRLATVGLAVVCIVAPLLAAGVARPVADRVDQRGEIVAYREPLLPFVRRECHNTTPLIERPPNECRFGDVGAPPTVALVGDSNGIQLAEAFVGAAEQSGDTVRIITASWCPLADTVRVTSPPATGAKTDARCRAWYEGTMEALLDDPPEVVVIANSTDDYVTDRITDRVSLLDPGTDVTVSGDARADVYADAMVRTIERLRDAGIRVAVAGIVPKPYDWDPRDCSAFAIITAPRNCVPPSFRPGSRDGEVLARRTEDQIAARAGVDLWRFDDRLCPAATCGGAAESVGTWHDDAHISDAAARSLADVVATRLEALRTKMDDGASGAARSRRRGW